MVHYKVEIQPMGEDEDNGYGYYCNLDPSDDPPLQQKLKNIPPELYPAEYYFDDDYDYASVYKPQYNDEYKKITNQFKTRAYTIFSEFSFACLCIATTFCIMKYYK